MNDHFGTSWAVTVVAAMVVVSAAGLLASAAMPAEEFSNGHAGLGTPPGVSARSAASASVAAPAPMAAVYSYAVVFIESGLPANASWTVALNGTPRSSVTTTISFAEPNGSYRYAVGGVAGFTPTPSGGTTLVNGSSLEVSVVYTPTLYAVTFEETGLGAGVTWYVTVNGLTVSSTSSTISFNEPNGSYSYRANATGYNPTSRTIEVAGTSPPTISIPFTSTSSANSISTSTWIIIGVIIAIVVVVGVAVTFHRRGGPRTGGSDST